MWPMLLAGAISAGTQIYSGYKQKEAADENAKLMRKQAQFQRDSAYDQAAQLNKQGQGFLGTQKSAFASSGVKVDEGSPLAVMNASRKAIQQDISRTRQMGDNALTLGNNQANQLEQQGKDAFTSSLIGAGTSFLTTASSAGAFEKGAFSSKIPETSPYGVGPMKDIAPNTSSWMKNSVGLNGYGGTPVLDIAKKGTYGSNKMSFPIAGDFATSMQLGNYYPGGKDFWKKQDYSFLGRQ